MVPPLIMAKCLVIVEKVLEEICSRTSGKPVARTNQNNHNEHRFFVGIETSLLLTGAHRAHYRQENYLLSFKGDHKLIGGINLKN